MDFGGLHFEKVAAVTDRDFFAGEMTAAINRRVGLGYQVIFFAIAGEIFNFVDYAAVHHFAIRRFDEPEFIDAGKGAHGADQTDVRTFRRFDGTNPAVVRRMHVANLESGPIARQTSRSERGQTTLVRQLRQRVRLIHELRELRTAEKVANDSAQCFGIDQLLWGHAVDVDVEQRHPLFHQSLGASETDTALICQQLADGPDTTAAEMIDVIQRAFAAPQVDEVFDCRDKIAVG